MAIVKTLCARLDAEFANRSDLAKVFPSSPIVQGKSSETLITHVRDRIGHDRRYAINYEKAGRELGYRPSSDFATGIRATIDWYLSNVAWWQKLLGRDYLAWVQKNYMDAKS